jgi:serine/threonine protein kinase
MEHVRGRPITEHCDAEGLTIDERLKLFRIARLLAPGGEPAGVMTRTLLPVMTPEYASPEQVMGGAITTATDVYALGLLLYEVLTGERAQRPSGASLLAIQRTICEEDARAPSDAFSAGAPEQIAARAAARGHGRVERLRKRLRGDLDTIVVTALRKDPTRRYASVDQLAADIERHLPGRPCSRERTRSHLAQRGARLAPQGDRAGFVCPRVSDRRSSG